MTRLHVEEWNFTLSLNFLWAKFLLKLDCQCESNFFLNHKRIDLFDQPVHFPTISTWLLLSSVNGGRLSRQKG